MACAELEALLADALKGQRATAPASPTVPEMLQKRAAHGAAKQAKRRSPSELELRERLYTMAWRLGYLQDNYRKELDSLQAMNKKLHKEKEAQARERLYLREMLYRATRGMPLSRAPFVDSEGSPMHVAGYPGSRDRPSTAGELVSTSRLIG